jgi:hypothetical protein
MISSQDWEHHHALAKFIVESRNITKLWDTIRSIAIVLVIAGG